jgi:formamidopyrimidine-DNA glycosylase
MPELPDLVYIEKKLNPCVLDREIHDAAVWEPIVLRVGVPGSFADIVRGRSIRGLSRHGPFLVFDLPPLQMIVHFMLVGFFKTASGKAAKKGIEKRLSRDHCFSLLLTGQTSVYYYDSKRMGKIYLVAKGNTAGIPGFDNQGVEVLSPEFTLEVFGELIRDRRNQVRVFLMDQSILSALGNAYSDEILFDAGIHPKTRCNQLEEEQVERLYNSVRSVLHRAIEQVQSADKGIDVKIRDHLKVRNRRGQACPVCGTTIRRTGVLGYDSFFCPKCQPELRSRLVSWDKLP